MGCEAIRFSSDAPFDSDRSDGGCAEAGTEKQAAAEPSGPLQPAEHFIYHKLMNGRG